jgi:hypothetical protein
MISDTLLIFLPLRTLCELKNQSRLRRRLQLIFTASALTTCASIVSGIFNLKKVGFGYQIAIEMDVRHLLFYLSSPSPFEFAPSLQSGRDVNHFLSSFHGCRPGSPSWSATSPFSPALFSNSATPHPTGQYPPLRIEEWASHPVNSLQ